MNETQPPNTTPDEEALIRHFMQRQRQAEEAESRILQRFGSRAALAKQVWGAIFGTAAAVVFGTVFVFTIKSDVEKNGRDLQQIRLDLQQSRAETQALSERVQLIRIEMTKKMDRKPDF